MYLAKKDFAVKTHSQILEEILKNQCITPVYQPIVSLTDGRIFGYEALSRVSRDYFPEIKIEQIFKIADKLNKSWELEKLCRTKALANAVWLDKDKKLFLNVNPNIIHDKEFKNGCTKECLNKYGLNFENIIFEITERVAILDEAAFSKSIAHYRNQNYGIAIDDFGSGYSGLNFLANVRPDIIKIDMNLIRNIDKDEIKQILCKLVVDFGKTTGVQIIAEGIETEEELAALIKLKVNFGQGYFFSMPQASFAGISSEKKELIKKYNGEIEAEKTTKLVAVLS